MPACNGPIETCIGLRMKRETPVEMISGVLSLGFRSCPVQRNDPKAAAIKAMPDPSSNRAAPYLDSPSKGSDNGKNQRGSTTPNARAIKGTTGGGKWTTAQAPAYSEISISKLPSDSAKPLCVKITQRDSQADSDSIGDG